MWCMADAEDGLGGCMAEDGGCALQVEKVKKAVDLAKEMRSDLFLEGVS